MAFTSGGDFVLAERVYPKHESRASYLEILSEHSTLALAERAQKKNRGGAIYSQREIAESRELTRLADMEAAREYSNIETGHSRYCGSSTQVARCARCETK